MGKSYGSDSPQSQSYSGKGKMGPDGNKEKSSKSGDFLKGGSHHMLTGMTAGPQTPGQSASQGGSGNKFKLDTRGNKDVPPQKAGPQQPGCSGHDVSGDGGKFASGGKGVHNKMFGYSPSKTATPA